MILGLGNDILNMERIQKLYQRHNLRFINRVFTAQEQHYAFLQKDPIRRFALRFAAKEAASKALGFGLRNGIQMIDIEILQEDNRKPYLKLHGQAEKIMRNLTPTNYLPQLDLALSDDPPYVLANVIFSCIPNLPY